MTRDDHGRPRAAAAPTTTTKAPTRGLQSFLGVSTFLALVVAAGGTPAEAGSYVYRAKAAPIEAAAAPAPAPVPGAAEWVGGSLVLRARTTYRSAIPYHAIRAAVVRERPGLTLDRVAAINGVAWAYLTTQNWTLDRLYLADKVREQVRPYGYASARAEDWTGNLFLEAGSIDLVLAPASPAGEAILRALDLRKVSR